MAKEKQPEKPKPLTDKEFAAKYETGGKVDLKKILNRLHKMPADKAKK